MEREKNWCFCWHQQTLTANELTQKMKLLIQITRNISGWLDLGSHRTPRTRASVPQTSCACVGFIFNQSLCKRQTQSHTSQAHSDGISQCLALTLSGSSWAWCPSPRQGREVSQQAEPGSPLPLELGEVRWEMRPWCQRRLCQS